MRSFTVARAAVLPFFGLLVAACSLGSGDDEDLALGRGNVSGAEKGRDIQAPSQDEGKGKGISLEGDVEFVPVEGNDHATDEASIEGKEIESKEIEGKGIEGKNLEQPLPDDLGKGGVTKEHMLPPKGDLGSSGDLPSKGVRVVNSACPKARVGDVVGTCVQALTYAKNPETGECCVYATPCDVPKTWDASFSAEAVCR
ncbi:hypothetical protein [Polyangium jinanense]|uniref:Secreted protein n=1 Tax=Polyangium jinanense TaxID=2829994 RepID=A0A9X4AUX1_9BACT|nr:hypothetical protein [Polyangium jinanense]MDC3959290.1 hypothetical protein [Polyangium jinanense]MDC3985699.1 hypothetical protein [Polyangium jinanense]